MSAHLLASSERAARLADFWQLVDLYAGLQGGGVPRLFTEKYWEETVLAALTMLPGRLASLFKEHAGGVVGRQKVDRGQAARS